MKDPREDSPDLSRFEWHPEGEEERESLPGYGEPETEAPLFPDMEEEPGTEGPLFPDMEEEPEDPGEAVDPVVLREQDLTDRSYIPEDRPDDGKNSRQALMILAGMAAFFLVLIVFLLVRLPAAIDSAFEAPSFGQGGGGSNDFFTFLTQERPSYGGYSGPVQEEETEEEDWDGNTFLEELLESLTGDEDFDKYQPDFSYLLSMGGEGPLEEIRFPIQIYSPYDAENSKETEYTDSIRDCAVTLQGTLLDFPMDRKALEAEGWKCVSDAPQEEKVLYPGEGACLSFEKDGRQVRFQVFCQTTSAQRAGDCMICGITAETGDSGFADLVLPEGMAPGDSTLEDLTAAYGEADCSDERYGLYGWTEGYYTGCIIRADKDGTVTGCSFMDGTLHAGFADKPFPEDLTFTEPEVSLPETPAPDGTDGVFSVGSGTYRALQPMQAFLEDGWTFEYPPDYVPAGQSSWVGLVRENTDESFSVTVLNAGPAAAAPKDCRVCGFSARAEEASFSVGPLSSGMDWEEAAEAAASTGLTCYGTGEDDSLDIIFLDGDTETTFGFFSTESGESLDEVNLYYDVEAELYKQEVRASIRKK